MDDLDVVIVGAGQAGLAVSHELTAAGVPHVVLERGRIGETWRRRWDSFCLVTPNWMLQLPGHPYAGDEPDAFMGRDEVIGYLRRYADAYDAPVHEGVAVTALAQRRGGGFELETSTGRLRARAVVLTTGAYQRPHRPPGAAALPPRLAQLDAEDYRNPGDLPAGAILVVGSGQSGCQIAEELRLAGRDVHLACGRAPWLPRRIGDRDLAWWLLESGFLDAPLSSLPDPAARLTGNVLATGRGGGRDLHLRTLQRLGVGLLGHFVGTDGLRARFATDLGESVAWGDARYAQITRLVHELADARGLPRPELPAPEPFRAAAPAELDLGGIGAVIFAGGFRPDYASWVRCPGAFDELGFPLQEDGASTVVDGLYFAGVHFLRKRKSALLVGVGEDAGIVARKIALAGAASVAAR